MSNPEKFFGTDGVRGRVNTGAITPGKALLLGQVIASRLSPLKDNNPASRSHAVIGKDSRRSGDMLENAIASGLHSVGMDVMLAGVVPTPAISMLVRKPGQALGSSSLPPITPQRITGSSSSGLTVISSLMSRKRKLAHSCSQESNCLKAVSQTMQ